MTQRLHDFHIQITRPFLAVYIGYIYRLYLGSWLLCVMIQEQTAHNASVQTKKIQKFLFCFNFHYNRFSSPGTVLNYFKSYMGKGGGALCWYVIDQTGRHNGKKNLRNVSASLTLVPKLLRGRSGGSIADRIGTKDPLKNSLGRVWASLYFHKIWKEFLCCMTLFVFN